MLEDNLTLPSNGKLYSKVLNWVQRSLWENGDHLERLMEEVSIRACRLSSRTNLHSCLPPFPSLLTPPVFDIKTSLGGWSRNGMPFSCCSISIVLFLFPLICWSVCSKKLCTPEPYYKLEVSPKELLSALVFIFLVCLFFQYSLLGMWLDYMQPHLSITVLLSSYEHTHTQRSEPWFWFFTFCYLNRCTFVAAALTGAPPRWFISPVGLLAAAGDQTEEPGLSHQGNESEKREGGEEHNCPSAASLCSQTTLCPHLSMAYMHMNPISTFIRTHGSSSPLQATHAIEYLVPAHKFMLNFPKTHTSILCLFIFYSP